MQELPLSLHNSKTSTTAAFLSQIDHASMPIEILKGVQLATPGNNWHQRRGRTERVSCCTISLRARKNCSLGQINTSQRISNCHPCTDEETASCRSIGIKQNETPRILEIPQRYAEEDANLQPMGSRQFGIRTPLFGVTGLKVPEARTTEPHHNPSRSAANVESSQAKKSLSHEHSRKKTRMALCIPSKTFPHGSLLRVGHHSSHTCMCIVTQTWDALTPGKRSSV